MGFEIRVDDELSLRLVEPQHAEETFAVLEANRGHIGRWQAWMTPGLTVEDLRENAKRALTEFAQRKQLAVSLVVEGRIVGRSGWTDWREEVMFDGRLSYATADIGYWLDQRYTGRGLMTRAVQALTTLAIQTYGIRRLTIHAEPGNERSWKVAERLGYTHEGTLRDVSRFDGRRVDHKLYSMLAEEWRP